MRTLHITASTEYDVLISDDLLEGSNALVFHDMPIHSGFEISQSVLDKHLETILDEAENRRHAEKAVLYYLLTQC